MHRFENLSKEIIGAAIRVHKELGPGFFESQKKIKIEYFGVEVGTHRLDLVVEDEIIVELKAVKDFADIHLAQLRSYLKATSLKVGLLINFAKPTLEVKRIVN